MMTLTYIFHSGFAIETDNCILVFDYWMDPSGGMQSMLSSDKNKNVYVFASHFHEDHFTREIFRWREHRECIFYILSKDIFRHRRAKKDEADVWMSKGTVWEDRNVKVCAMGSNDSGVSWIVEVGGKTIFHAGDLCNWYARYLNSADMSDEIFSEEFGVSVNPVAEEKRFLGELKDIRKKTGRFDLVMFPVDGRIGNGYTLGARQFIERFEVGVFVPMHFVASGFESAWRMEPFCHERNIAFWRIGREGERLLLTEASQTP